MEKVEKIGYHSNFDFECNTGRGFKESLSRYYSLSAIADEQLEFWHRGKIAVTVLAYCSEAFKLLT